MKIRFRYSKLGKVRWTSQRDVARMWERALRRAGLPVAYSQGFSPRPLLSFGLALPTGCESLGEYVDVATTQPLDVAGLGDCISTLLPAGVDVQAVAGLPDGSASLQQAVTSCVWQLDVCAGSTEELRRQVAGVLSAGSLPIERERKGRVELDDLRPAIVRLQVVGSDQLAGQEFSTLLAEVLTQPRGVRPPELCSVLGAELWLARRTHHWIEHDGRRSEPLPIDAPQVRRWKDAS